MHNTELNMWGEFKCPAAEHEFQDFYWENKKAYFFISYFTCTFLFMIHGIFDFRRTFVLGSPEILMGLRVLFLVLCLIFISKYKDKLSQPKHLYEFCFLLKMFSVLIIFLLTIFTEGLSLTLHIGAMIMIASFYICLPAKPLYALLASLSISAVFIFGASPEQEGMTMHILKSFILLASNVIMWFYCKASQKSQRLEFTSSQNLKTIADMKGKFLTTLAHDLRTPLTIIAGRNRLIQKRLEKDFEQEKVQAYTESIADNIKTINDMIEGLIHWTINQNERSYGPDNEIKSHLSVTVNNAIHFVSEMAKNKGISISTDLSENNINHDSIMIETILRNLLNNAIKFSPENSKLKIKSFIDDGYHIEILDNASFLADEDIKKIESGSSLESRPGTHNEKGTGLGLKLIHSFLKAQNGTLKVFHHKKGNVFRITLRPN